MSDVGTTKEIMELIEKFPQDAQLQILAVIRNMVADKGKYESHLDNGDILWFPYEENGEISAYFTDLNDVKIFTAEKSRKAAARDTKSAGSEYNSSVE